MVAVVLWICGYIALISVPLVALIAGPAAGSGELWWDFAMALGYAGLAIMGVQFTLTARFRRANAPFGIDVVYYFHRWMAVAGLGMIAAHVLILRARYLEALGQFSPFRAEPYMTAGRAAFAFFAVVVATSLWRKAMRIEYDWWRLMHIAGAVAAVILSVVHVIGAGYFTAPGWKAALIGAYSLGWLTLVGYVRIYRPWSIARRPYRVAKVDAERGHAWTLTLEPDGHDGLKFLPGQFAWLTIRRSPFAGHEHPFSFAGSATDAPRLRFTIKELGDFTRTIGTIQPGERVYVDGPHGVFTPDRQAGARGFVFVAGGVGIAPIMSMLRTLSDRGDPRPRHLILANVRWDDVILREEIEDLSSRGGANVTHVLANPHEGWSGHAGLVDVKLLRAALPVDLKGYVCFVCGPTAMSAAAQRALREMGVPLSGIRSELFDMV